jgi:hypothetical protein
VKERRSPRVGGEARLCRRQLVRKLRPLAFHDRTHLIGDDRDLLNLEHIIRRRHDFAIDDARRVGALISQSGQLTAR